MTKHFVEKKFEMNGGASAQRCRRRRRRGDEGSALQVSDRPRVKKNLCFLNINRIIRNGLYFRNLHIWVPHCIVENSDTANIQQQAQRGLAPPPTTWNLLTFVRGNAGEVSCPMTQWQRLGSKNLFHFFILWLLITAFLRYFMAIIATHWSFKILLLLLLSSKIIIHQSQDIFMLHLLHLGFGRLMRLSEIELKYICVVLKWVSWRNNQKKKYF